MNTPSAWKKTTVVLATSALLLAACVSDPVKFGQPPDLQTGKKYDAGRGRIVTGRACGFHLLYLIPISTNERAARAFEKVRWQAGDDYITDVHVQERWIYGFAGTLYCTAIRATVYPWITS